MAGPIKVLASDLRGAKPSNSRGLVTPTKTFVAAVRPTPVKGWSVTPNARGSTVVRSMHCSSAPLPFHISLSTTRMPYLGKGDSLRAAGIPVPTGGSAHDLARLDTLIRRLGAERLRILGDLLHGTRTAGSWREHWRACRQQRASLDIRLVTGNHDGAAPNAGLDIACHPDEIEDGPFLLAHQPARHAPAGLLRICGHLHPVVRVPRLPGRFPAFVIGSSQIVLPAFSAFTGGTPADPLARHVA
ncbi:metallophosphoesterase [Pseudochelatococcus sp. B33]